MEVNVCTRKDHLQRNATLYRRLISWQGIYNTELLMQSSLVAGANKGKLTTMFIYTPLGRLQVS